MNWPKITKDTPLEEVKRIHQKIWDYAIEHGEKPSTPYRNDCAACEYCHVTCKHCPIDWKDDLIGIVLFGCSRLYRAWNGAQHISENEERAISLAKKIRDIPFKYETREESHVRSEDGREATSSRQLDYAESIGTATEGESGVCCDRDDNFTARDIGEKNSKDAYSG